MHIFCCHVGSGVEGGIRTFLRVYSGGVKSCHFGSALVVSALAFRWRSCASTNCFTRSKFSGDCTFGLQAAATKSCLFAFFGFFVDGTAGAGVSFGNDRMRKI